ncbi:MAG: thiol:disulfide interchange protein DsbA/DsbL [Campylobacteraceae bacterium]|jgi:thiol:disulfide interchange protein DsbA|nr:thiol:disulfide interchange protein DsbA/DsbL [Campylobacteraceae bacterium]
MKKFLLNIAKLAAVFALFAANTFGFSEGEDYVKLANPIPNADKTLIKVFSYDCPFCYKYDKSVTPTVVKQLEGVLTFKPFHLKTKGKYGKEASELFAALIVKDDSGNIKPTDEVSLFKKAKMAYYSAYHDQKNRWDGGENSFIAFGLKASGISEDEFENLKNTEKAKDIISQWDASYEVAKIQGVPAFVVNGKYLIYTKSITSIDKMVDLIKELAEK